MILHCGLFNLSYFCCVESKDENTLQLQHSIFLWEWVSPFHALSGNGIEEEVLHQKSRSLLSLCRKLEHHTWRSPCRICHSCWEKLFASSGAKCPRLFLTLSHLLDFSFVWYDREETAVPRAEECPAGDHRPGCCVLSSQLSRTEKFCRIKESCQCLPEHRFFGHSTIVGVLLHIGSNFVTVIK